MKASIVTFVTSMLAGAGIVYLGYLQGRKHGYAAAVRNYGIGKR